MPAFIAETGDNAAGKVQLASEYYYPSSIRYNGYENHKEVPAYL